MFFFNYFLCIPVFCFDFSVCVFVFYFLVVLFFVVVFCYYRQNNITMKFQDASCPPLGRRISDQGVPGSNPGRCTFRCGLEQVTFTLLSTG